jgi:photosystem II stability/assembly factor-like uncharacterized protein
MAGENDNTVFVAVGPGKGAGTADGKSGVGLYRLRPGATEWEIVAGGLPQGTEVRCIAQHPIDSKTLFVGTQDGPFRSRDGGESWQKLNFPEKGAVLWSIEVHPSQPDIVYCGAAPVALYRSADGGDTWQRLQQFQSPAHCEADGFDTRAMCVTFNPANPDEVYVGLEVGGVMHSGDGGETWTDVSGNLMELAQEHPHLQSNVGGRSCGVCEGMLDTHAMAISAAAPDIAFLGVRMGIFKTEDGGATWQDIGIARFSPLIYCHDVIVSPHDPNVLYAAMSSGAFSADGSLYRSNDLGQTWTRIDHGIAVDSTVMGLASDPNNSAVLYSVGRTGQVLGTQDNGSTWHDYTLPDDVGYVYEVVCA